MGQEGKIKHAFPGGNTSRGFHSFYDYILPQSEADRIIVIKGGPGVGKSTFMRRIGLEMCSMGYNVEFMHCSSDNNSLDGIVITDLKIAMIDGTAPHIVDPKHPGAIDEIIHLGDFWNEEGLRQSKNDIILITSEISSLFSRAYKYLGAGKYIYDDIEKVYDEAIDMNTINKEAERISTTIFDGFDSQDKASKERHLFISAITPEGPKNFISNLVEAQENIYIVKGPHGKGLNKIFARIAESAVTKGFDIEFYHCAFNPEVIEHIVIPEIQTIITTSREYHTVDVISPTQIIDLHDYLNNNIIDKYSEVLEYDKAEFDNLFNKAVEKISQAKALHDKLETYYVPNMDFESIENLRKRVLEKILKKL
ncbi:MAG: PRK06851 family protein [Deltaproteobacteria bacterium]